MKRMFIETGEFRKCWKKLGLGEEDLRELQGFLLEHPEAGDMIQGAGGENFAEHDLAGANREGCGRFIWTLLRNLRYG